MVYDEINPNFLINTITSSILSDIVNNNNTQNILINGINTSVT